MNCEEEKVKADLNNKASEYYQTVYGWTDWNNAMTVGADGYLKVTASPADGEMTWLVVKVYTMPDNQPAVKIQRIA